MSLFLISSLSYQDAFLSGVERGDVRASGLGYVGVPYSIILTLEGSNNLGTTC